jgi:hypothetical protein
VLHNLHLGAFVMANGKPLDWGIGGPDRWPDAKPYHTPEGCQDQRGLHIADWYEDISASVLGSALPMITIAGGAVLAQSTSAHTRLKAQQTETAVAIARMLESGRINPQLCNFNFYLLAAEPGHPDRDWAWFQEIDKPRRVVQHMRDYVESLPRRVGPSLQKPLSHYVLLPGPGIGGFERRWARLGALVAEARPVVGFSLHEAKLARRVTIAAGESQIPEDMLEMLRESGCTVQRLPPTVLDGFSTQEQAHLHPGG